MEVFSSIGFWVFAVALTALSCLWGFIERRKKLFRQGMYHPGLGYERTGKAVMISQGIVSVLIFVMFGLEFWLFGWKVGLVAVIVSFALGAITS